MAGGRNYPATKFVQYDPERIAKQHAEAVRRYTEAVEHEIFYGKPAEPITVEVKDITPERLALPAPKDLA